MRCDCGMSVMRCRGLGKCCSTCECHRKAITLRVVRFQAGVLRLQTEQEVLLAKTGRCRTCRRPLSGINCYNPACSASIHEKNRHIFAFRGEVIETSGRAVLEVG